MCSLRIFVLEDGKAFIRRKGGKSISSQRSSMSWGTQKGEMGGRPALGVLQDRSAALVFETAAVGLGQAMEDLSSQTPIFGLNLWAVVGHWDAGLEEGYNKDVLAIVGEEGNRKQPFQKCQVSAKSLRTEMTNEDISVSVGLGIPNNDLSLNRKPECVYMCL